MILQVPNKGLAFFIANSLCVLSASRLTLFATSWWMVEETGNASGLARMMALALLIEVACRFLFANVGDVFNKKLIVILTSLATGLSSLFLFWILAPGVHYLLIWLPIVTLSICNAIRMPVNASLLRFIVPESSLSRAISINQGVNTFGTMIVPILAGGLISLLGVQAGLFLSALMSAISIIFLKRIVYQQTSREFNNKSLMTIHQESWCDFLKILPEVTFAIICALLNGVLYAFFSVFVPYFSSSVSADGAWIMGTLDGAFSIGLFLDATFIIGKNIIKSTPMGRVMVGFIGITLTFIILAIIVFYQSKFTSIPAIVFSMSAPLIIGGASLFLINNGISVIRMHASPKVSLSSIMAFSASISGTLIPVGLFFGGQIIDLMGMEAFCFVTAAMMILSTLVLMFNPHISAIAKLKEMEMTDLYARRYLNT